MNKKYAENYILILKIFGDTSKNEKTWII